ncbi:hypothetical protein PV08_00620 [Exophiala spinifera]|uniref:Uncharacterized protein n=1 Tax=Exophiala spinifera TaxID=91928 RepID=A0A0D2BNE4_9EURO|nr:uncharacterized protein PV08_00620 [Exophiala spinifera]KIW20045.1 hypothetical protein PV08_00620 [Exophiala spinifera]
MRVPLLSAHKCCSHPVRLPGALDSRSARGLLPVAIQRRNQSTTLPSPSAPSKSLLDRTAPNPATLYYDSDAKYHRISLTPLPTHVQRSISQDLSSTHPAPLDTPPPLKRTDYDDGQIPLKDKVHRLFKVGKAYLQFYKTGLKNIWRNYKELRAIRARLGTDKLEDLIKYGRPRTLTEGRGPRSRQEGVKATNDQIPPLTRREYQLALRTRHDLFKLVPFSLILAICGEFTPLVILATGSAVVPFPCRIPQQERQDFMRPLSVQPAVDKALERVAGPAREPETRQAASRPVVNWDWRQEFIYAHRLHLNPFLTPVPLLGALWHRIYVLPRLRKHCHHIVCDTILIRREGGFARLSPREVFRWSLNHGLRSLTHYVDDRSRRGLPIDPDSPDLKKALLPVVQAEADYLLSVDWSRVKPEDHWRAAFRPVGSVTPDDRNVLRR